MPLPPFARADDGEATTADRGPEWPRVLNLCPDDPGVGRHCRVGGYHRTRSAGHASPGGDDGAAQRLRRRSRHRGAAAVRIRSTVYRRSVMGASWVFGVTGHGNPAFRPSSAASASPPAPTADSSMGPRARSRLRCRRARAIGHRACGSTSCSGQVALGRRDDPGGAAAQGPPLPGRRGVLGRELPAGLRGGPAGHAGGQPRPLEHRARAAPGACAATTCHRPRPWSWSAPVTGRSTSSPRSSPPTTGPGSSRRSSPATPTRSPG